MPRPDEGPSDGKPGDERHGPAGAPPRAARSPLRLLRQMVCTKKPLRLGGRDGGGGGGRARKPGPGRLWGRHPGPGPGARRDSASRSHATRPGPPPPPPPRGPRET